MSFDTVFVGGPVDGQNVCLDRAPKHILVGVKQPQAVYARIDDPDTGEYLGGYIYESEEAECRCTITDLKRVQD